MKKYLLLLLIPFILGCTVKEEFNESMSINQIYNKASNYYHKKKYKKALEGFQSLERLYPYSDLTIETEIMIGYLKFLRKEYVDAIENFKLFIDLHPYHPQVPYAIYMIGMSHFKQLSIVERDQSAAVGASEYFLDLIENYPNSKFTKDAKLQLKEIEDHLAGKLLNIGLFYQFNLDCPPAINRYLEALNKYSGSKYVPNILERLVECYMALNQKHIAQSFEKKLKALKN